jgi:predicted  nucleic acid-binding Zn-ribbon protein
MEPGELEHRKAFEETATKNIKTVVDYSTDTRRIVRELQIKVDSQDKQIVLLNQLINDLRAQLATTQAKLYKGGTD